MIQYFDIVVGVKVVKAPLTCYNIVKIMVD